MPAMMQSLYVVSLAILLLLQCSSYGAHQTQCESGVIASDYCSDRNCFNIEKTAQFSLAFEEPPAVPLGFIHLDTWKDENTRVTIDNSMITHPSAVISPPFVTKEKLSVSFYCWDTSVCYRAAISWMACGWV